MPRHATYTGSSCGGRSPPWPLPSSPLPLPCGCRIGIRGGMPPPCMLELGVKNPDRQPGVRRPLGVSRPEWRGEAPTRCLWRRMLWVVR